MDTGFTNAVSWLFRTGTKACDAIKGGSVNPLTEFPAGAGSGEGGRGAARQESICQGGQRNPRIPRWETRTKDKWGHDARGSREQFDGPGLQHR